MPGYPGQIIRAGYYFDYPGEKAGDDNNIHQSPFREQVLYQL